MESQARYVQDNTGHHGTTSYNVSDPKCFSTHSLEALNTFICVSISSDNIH